MDGKASLPALLRKYVSCATPPNVAQQYQGVPQYGGAPQPPAQYDPPQSAGGTQDHIPSTPTPSITTLLHGKRDYSRDMLTHTMDWLFSLPSNIAIVCQIS